MPPERVKQVGVDQHIDHARPFVAFDEAHTAHVAGEVEDGTNVGDHLLASLAVAKVGHDVLGIRMDLVPPIGRLDVDCSDLAALGKEAGHKVAADETTGTGDEGWAIGGHGCLEPSQD